MSSDHQSQIDAGSPKGTTPETSIMSEDEQWTITIQTLEELLDRHGGIVSSKLLVPELESRGIAEARKMNTWLRLYNFDDPSSEVAVPRFRYYHRGRSFYSENQYQLAECDTETAAEAAEQEAITEEPVEIDSAETSSLRRRNRQEEARLGKYVEEALETIYASDYGPDARIAFDVHSARCGNEYENVDVLAVHWRAHHVVELVAVEVKLQFSPRLVLQARNYQRFAHRVWIAVPVSSDEPAIELREADPQLFEYVVQNGLGILACRRRQGSSYKVSPVHWPGLNELDSIARDGFVERHRSEFEQARVIEPIPSHVRPRLR
jgi:hypothetical protein